MSTHLDPKSLAELAKLTHVREMAALDQVSRAARQVAAIDAEIETLRDRSFTVETVLDAAMVERWQRWQREELVRLQQRKARLIVDHRKAMTEYGRATAEHAVLKKLGKRAEAEKAKSARSNQPYIS